VKICMPIAVRTHCEKRVRVGAMLTDSGSGARASAEIRQLTSLRSSGQVSYLG